MVMLTAGIDVGAATAKTVIFKDSKIIGYAIRPVGHDIKLVSHETNKEALHRAGLSISIEDLDYIVSTGQCQRSYAMQKGPTS
jgi:activator of 2-hydroxyglutaryl-CoA dehydratase